MTIKLIIIGFIGLALAVTKFISDSEDIRKLVDIFVVILSVIILWLKYSKCENKFYKNWSETLDITVAAIPVLLLLVGLLR